MSIIEYECLPSYSSMQYAEIADMDGSIIVPRFAMRSGLNFQYFSLTVTGPFGSRLPKGKKYMQCFYIFPRSAP